VTLRFDEPALKGFWIAVFVHKTISEAIFSLISKYGIRSLSLWFLMLILSLFVKLSFSSNNVMF